MSAPAPSSSPPATSPPIANPSSRSQPQPPQQPPRASPPGTPMQNKSLMAGHSHQMSDPGFMLTQFAASHAATASAVSAGGLAHSSISPPQPLFSAPTRGAGLWASSSASATPASASPCLPFPLVRPAQIVQELGGLGFAGGSSGSAAAAAASSADAAASAAARAASASAWMVPPASSHLPPRTKLICTIGPASQSPERIRAMLLAGMNVARLNFSHGDHEYHRLSIANLRDVMADSRRICAILLDTKGPEIRTGKLKDASSVALVRDQTLTLTTDDSFLGDAQKIAVIYANLPKLVKPGTHILIDDGLIDLVVLESNPSLGEVKCRVLNNATLGASKGVNLPGVAVDLPAVTQKDVADLKLAVDQGVDFIAASFVRRASDVLTIRKILGQKGAGIKIIAKIESQEGLDHFASILAVSDGIMVARGDLGVEIPIEQVALAQKMMIRACNMAGKFVITATQMLESMMVNPSPTRAEASDVANAVLDGTDCVMLSGETASGRFPVESVQMMADICREAEASVDHVAASQALREDLRVQSVSVMEAIASSSVRATFDLRAAVIIVLTETGTTARLVSKYRPLSPILTVTSSEQTARQSLVSRGLFPLLVGSMVGSDSLINRVLVAATRLGMCKQGDLAVITSGSREATAGATNDMKVVCVGT